MTVNLEGRTALVTGAGSGIGLELTRLLLARGVRVAGVGRRADRLAEVPREPGEVERFLALPADVSVPGAVAEVVAAVSGAWCVPDILVLNAGTARFDPITETTIEDWDRTLATNLSGPFYLVRRLLPDLLKQKQAHVLFNVSVAAIRAFPNCSAYGASKAGLLGLARVLREETRGTSVRVTALLPGATETAIWGEDRPPGERLMPARAVAESALWALTSDPAIVPEELVLRPRHGDLD